MPKGEWTSLKKNMLKMETQERPEGEKKITNEDVNSGITKFLFSTQIKGIQFL